MNLNEFILKMKTLDIDIKKINDQKTNILQEMFPFIGKCIQVTRQDTIWLIKCTDVKFQDGYYQFTGTVIKAQGDGFSFNQNHFLAINPMVIGDYKFDEIAEEQFDDVVRNKLIEFVLNPEEENAEATTT
jgi:hypothetical protein